MTAIRVIRRMRDLHDVTGTSGENKAAVSDGAAGFPLTQIVTQQDLDAILTSVAHVEWHPITLLNGFTNYGQGYAPARYRLTLNSTVYVEGRIKRSPPFRQSDAPLVIAKLGAGTLPGPILSYGLPTDTERVVRIEVRETQGVTEIVFAGFIGAPAGAQATTLALSTIVYSIEQAGR